MSEMILREAVLDGDTVRLDLWYPRCGTNARFIEVGLMSVRAADEVRLSYDFDRDGWVVEQASIFEWESGDTAHDRGWKEVAFVPAWQFHKDEERHS